MLTVVGWNALAMALVVAYAVMAGAQERAHPSDPEGWTGLVLLIVVILAAVAISASAAIGLIVTMVRSYRNPPWMAPTASTGAVILAGTRLAAWGLLAFVPVILLVFHPWAW